MLSDTPRMDITPRLQAEPTLPAFGDLIDLDLLSLRARAAKLANATGGASEHEMRIALEDAYVLGATRAFEEVKSHLDASSSGTQTARTPI